MSSSHPMLLPFLLLWCLALPGGHTFFPNFWSKFLSVTWGSYTHQDLTEEAVLNITLQILLDNKHPSRPALRWEDFEGKTLTPDGILRAYYGDEVSLRQYRASMRQIVSANANMDFLNGTRNDPIRHFDSERVRLGNSLLLRAREDLLRYIRAKEYEGAREILGQILHALQDFYSHTNWVELGHTDIHPYLATPGKDISSLAGVSDQTCTDCTDVSCQNNIVATIQKRHLLTSGYYGESPVKPRGKCSHGGPFDHSKEFSAKGGINKDTAMPLFSPHHFLHERAAKLALKASIKFLNDLRREVTDNSMLRMLGVSAFPALSFVLDTTGSMGEEITSARLQSRHIIQRQKDTLLQPDYYILVPFHDPGFGPVHKTSDPDEFLKILDSLQALGGGDEPEMCMSALQLALINTPPYSEIFVFTDASSKDTHLRSSVEALIQEKKIKVSFLITEDPSRTTVKRSKREILNPDRFDLYTELASTSGGQVVFTTNSDISKASEIIMDSAHFDLVTLLYKQSYQRGTPSSTFLVDEFIYNVTLFINGNVKRFHIFDPEGHKHHGDRSSHGKFTRVFLQDPLKSGTWRIDMETFGSYSIRVQGRSSLDILYYFGTPVNGSHPGLYELNNKLVTGVPVVLLVDVIGLPESANLSHLDLTPGNGETLTMELEAANEKGLLMVHIGEFPFGDFSLSVSGTDGKGHKVKREAPQQLRSEVCSLEMSCPVLPTPGNSQIMSVKITNHEFPVLYCVTMNTSPYNILNDFIGTRVNMSASDSQVLDLNISIPNNVEPGTVITLIAEAIQCGTDIPTCFTQLSLVVADKDEVSPTQTPSVCPQPTFSGSCPESLLPSMCKDRWWSAHLLVIDADGITSVQILNGSGSASYGPDGEYEFVHFTSTCCDPQAELLLTNYRDATWLCSFQAPTADINTGQLFYLLTLLPIVIALPVLGVYLMCRNKDRKAKEQSKNQAEGIPLKDP